MNNRLDYTHKSDLGGADCLNTVRLLAAIQVMYGHTITHLNIEMPDIVTSIITFFLGVPIFFTLSGYLIWGSISRSKSYKVYLKKRFWRIYPELWCAIIVEIMVMIALYHHSYDIRQFLLFIFGQATIFQFWTPECLRDYGVGSPNGALWAICVLIQFYLLAYPLNKILHGKNKWVWIITIIVAILASIATPIVQSKLDESLGKLYGLTIIQYLWMFLMAAFVAEKKEVVLPFLKKYWYVFLIGVLLIRLYNHDIKAGYGLFKATCLFLGLLGAAYVLPYFNIKTDISYGIYIYHMTIVNALYHTGNKENIVYLYLVIVSTFFIAWVSTKTVGQWGLNKKKYI